MDRLI